MHEAAAREYYKAHEVAGDARFAIRDGNGKPNDLELAWALLLSDIEQSPKETAEHKKRRDALRLATRYYMDGRPYVLPARTLLKPARVAKPKACPHCGGAL
jgi:hypothetical protein